MARNTTLVRVTGMSFHPGYPDTILDLAASIEQATTDDILSTTSWGEIDGPSPEGPTVLLVRRPDNEYDANAIEVHVPSLGRYGFVGHVPAEIAARWAKRIDPPDPQIPEAHVSAVPIDPGHLELPGLEIAVTFHLPSCLLGTGGNICTCGDAARDWR